MPFLKGDEEESPRKGFIYWSDDGDCMAMRVGRYKIHFTEQRATGIGVWREPLSQMRVPKVLRPPGRSVRARRRELQVRRLADASTCS